MGRSRPLLPRDVPPGRGRVEADAPPVGREPADGHPRPAHRPAQPRAAAGPLRARAARDRAHRTGRSACCCSTSTGSRRSTTPSATTTATSCCSSSAPGCPPRCARATPWRRLGGDEFVIVLAELAGTRTRSRSPSGSAPPSPSLPARRYRASTVEPSIGLALAPEHGESFETLLQCADIAMYAAKETHRRHRALRRRPQPPHAPPGCCCSVTLRRALADPDQLQLHYQPKIDLVSGQHRRGRGAGALAAPDPRPAAARPSSSRPPRAPA